METTTFTTTTSGTTGFALRTAGCWRNAVATAAVGAEGRGLAAGHGYASMARQAKQVQALLVAVVDAAQMPKLPTTSKPAGASRLVATHIDGDPRTWRPPV